MKGKIVIQHITYKADVVRIILDEDTYMSIAKDDMKIFNNRKEMINMMLNLSYTINHAFKQIKY